MNNLIDIWFLFYRNAGGFKIDKSVSHSSSQFIKLHFEWYWNVSWNIWRPITFFLITFVLSIQRHSKTHQAFRKICYIYATVPCLFKTELFEHHRWTNKCDSFILYWTSLIKPLPAFFLSKYYIQPQCVTNLDWI